MFQLGKTIFKHDKVKIVKLSLQLLQQTIDTDENGLRMYPKNSEGFRPIILLISIFLSLSSLNLFLTSTLKSTVMCKVFVFFLKLVCRRGLDFSIVYQGWGRDWGGF